MTFTGKIFKSYVETIVDRHGFNSNKMIPIYKTDYIMHLRFMAVQREREHEDSEARLIYKSFIDTTKWLIDNGYLREYDWATYNKSYHESPSATGTSIGLTKKGWAVAQKYLDAQ